MSKESASKQDQNDIEVSDSEIAKAIEDSMANEQRYYSQYKKKYYQNFNQSKSNFSVQEKQTSLQNFFGNSKSKFGLPKKSKTYFQPSSKLPYDIQNTKDQIFQEHNIKIKIYGKNKERKKYNYKKEQIPKDSQLEIRHEFCPSLKIQYSMSQKNYWSYQFDITMKGLLQNIIVCLPTGMGKTLIAYNIIYNFYNWYVEGQIFFFAPTRPLIQQQYEKFKKLEIVKEQDVVLLTGKENYEQRKINYINKKIFFMTPQTFENDLLKNKQEVDNIVLVIYDECHKALGNYSYCRISNGLQEKGCVFRSIGLTATPGENISTFWEISKNIMAQSLQIRLKNDSQVWRYTQDTNIYPILIYENAYQKYINKNTTKILKQIQDNLRPILTLKNEIELMPNNNQTFNYKKLIKIQKSYISNKEQYNDILNYEQKQICFDSFQILKKIFLFKRHITDQSNKGSIMFEQILKYLQMSDNQYCKDLLQSEYIQNLDNAIKQNTQQTQKCSKIVVLLKLIQKYLSLCDQFQNKKIIIFTHTKQNAFTIKNQLQKNNIKKCAIFIGQDKKSKTDIQMTQQQQIETLDNFNSGLINILIATSVAEEGLDINEVNLILCFDSGLNPTRLIQRFGRTGRNKQGQVVLLLNSLELKQYIESKKKYRQYTEQLEKVNRQKSNFYQKSPCMIPKCINTLELKVCQIQSKNKKNKTLPFYNNLYDILQQMEKESQSVSQKNKLNKKNPNEKNVKIDDFFRKKKSNLQIILYNKEF